MQHGPLRLRCVLVEGDSSNLRFNNLDAALQAPDTQLRLFGKPEVKGKRRMGVALARGTDIENARDKALKVADAVVTEL